MPTNPAVSSATPNDLGPTSCSWSLVFCQWILPAGPAERRRDGAPGAELRVAAGRGGTPVEGPGLGWAAARTLTYPGDDLPAQHHAGDCAEQPARRLEAVEQVEGGDFGGRLQQFDRGCVHRGGAAHIMIMMGLAPPIPQPAASTTRCPGSPMMLCLPELEGSSSADDALAAPPGCCRVSTSRCRLRVTSTRGPLGQRQQAAGSVRRAVGAGAIWRACNMARDARSRGNNRITGQVFRLLWCRRLWSARISHSPRPPPPATSPGLPRPVSVALLTGICARQGASCSTVAGDWRRARRWPPWAPRPHIVITSGQPPPLGGAASLQQPARRSHLGRPRQPQLQAHLRPAAWSWSRYRPQRRPRARAGQDQHHLRRNRMRRRKRRMHRRSPTPLARRWPSSSPIPACSCPWQPSACCCSSGCRGPY